MDLRISTLTLETFILVFARIAGFVAVAPLFGHRAINARLRILIAACISITVFSAMNFEMAEYSTILGYTILLIKELVIGLSIGFVSSFVMSVLVLAGEFIDREIGFTMSQTFDPSSNAMVTITAELYDRIVYLIILITNLHYYILKAIAQSFEVVPLGHININYAYLYTQAISFIGQYFSIGFRIAMPVFLGTIILNVILGILTKSSPQMNMFAIGMQLKVIGGLLIMTIVIVYIPSVANYLVEKMNDMVTTILGGL
ncbi:MAG: flagellar biosynthetic protein FliR [Lachnospiraceae bacterium]|nr:flagellar biosynthetic protein FliR [Lachnospiraceae bacterium]